MIINGKKLIGPKVQLMISKSKAPMTVLDKASIVTRSELYSGNILSKSE